MPTSNLRLAALAAGGGALALAVIGGGYAALGWWTGRGSSGAAEGPQAPSPAAQAARAGMHARGTAELRGVGCDEPAVIDLQRLLGDAGAVHDGEPRYVVTCDVTTGTPPTCDRAAEAYFGAMKGTCDGNVAVRVSRAGAPTPLCSRLYAPTGAPLD